MRRSGTLHIDKEPYWLENQYTVEKCKEENEVSNKIRYLYSFTVHVVIVHCLKTQLMHCALKYALKHNHSLKHWNVCVCYVTLHVSVIHLTIFRGCSLYNAAFRLVASSQFYLGMWLYLLSVLLSCLPLCCRSCCSCLTQQDRQQRGIHDNNTDRRYSHIPK